MNTIFIFCRILLLKEMSNNQTNEIDIPDIPDFSDIKLDKTINCEMLLSGYNVISKFGAWNILRNFNEYSYLFSENNDIKNILLEIRKAYPSHNGISLSTVMYHLEDISKNGFHKYKIYRGK